MASALVPCPPYASDPGEFTMRDVRRGENRSKFARICDWVGDHKKELAIVGVIVGLAMVLTGVGGFVALLFWLGVIKPAVGAILTFAVVPIVIGLGGTLIIESRTILK